MDNLLLIIGIAVMIISTIMIIRAKKTSSKKSEDSYLGEVKENIVYSDKIDFTDEEVEFISNFEARETSLIKGNEDFDLNLKKSIYKNDLESQDLEYQSLGADEKETGQETDKKEAIAILYREGLSESEIAKKLEMGRREVNIILKVKGLIK